MLYGLSVAYKILKHKGHIICVAVTICKGDFIWFEKHNKCS